MNGLPNDPATSSKPALGQELLPTLLESIGDGFVALDPEWRFTYVNAPAERFLGRGRAQLLGHSLWDVFPETLDTPFARGFRRAVEETTEVAFEEFYPPLDKWFEVRAFPFRGGLSILFQDVTRRRQGELALRESEERYRSLVENIDLGITLIDRNHRILMSNAAQGRLFDRPAAEFVNRECFREFEQRDAVCPHCPGVTAMASGRPVRIEVDGAPQTVQINAFPVFDPDGVARKFIEVVEDISEWRRTRDELRHSEERFRSIFEHAGAGMNTLGPDGRFLQANQAFCEFTGYSEAELQQLTPLDLTHPDDRPVTKRLIEEARNRQRSSYSYEKRFVRKDGQVIWGQVSTAWLFDRQALPVFAIGLIQDITPRKQTEARLQQALAESSADRERIDGILSSIADGLLVTDNDQQITQLNPAARNLLGLTAKACDRPLGELPLDATLRRQLETPFPADGGELCCDFSLAAQGTTPARVVQARTAPYRGAGGKTVGTITILRDVTREREIEQIKSEFISAAAHEMRTPLASVLGYAELLLQMGKLPTPGHQEYLGKICEKAEALSRIIDDLFDLSRIESGRLITLALTEVRPGELLRQVADQYRESAVGHRLILELPASDPVLRLDREKLLQVMENLLGNAVKYSPGGGTITVCGRLDQAGYRVSVRDRGIGMTPEQVARIFDKFYRADTSDTAVGGLGIGMTIVQKIIEAHGGTIEVSSELHRGTTVTFTLPLQDPG